MSGTQIQIGTVRYDATAARLIALSGDDIQLRAQSAQVLAFLAENLGQLVSRDSLFSNVWGDLAVTDDSLTQCIADIRRALKDNDHKLLQTVPKRGYILKATPVENDLPQQARTEASGPGKAPAKPNFDGTIADLDPRDLLPTLAVLPLLGIAGNTNDALSIFVADEITATLARSKEINVISRLSTASYRNPGDEPSNLRQLLNADFVVSGHVWHDSREAVLSLEFAETDSRYVLWSDRVRHRRSALLENTDWVEQITSNIRNAIMVREVSRLQSMPMESLRLYSILYGAVGLMHRLSLSDFERSRKILAYLTEQAPHNPVPRAWMARWHVLRAVQGWSDNPQQEAKAAIDWAEHALELDPNSTLAMSSMGFAMTSLLRRFDEAKLYYDSALAINPNDAQARALRGMLQAFCDKPSEGKRDAERALHLTPQDPHRFFYLVLAAGTNLSAGNYERAVSLAKASRHLNRTHVSTLRTLAAAQVGAGDVAGARETVTDLMRMQPGLRVSTWLRTAPSGNYENGKRFAELLTVAGVPV